MTYICPLCNAMEPVNINCPDCQSQMVDGGRFMDFLDNYSPYLEIDGVKKADGVSYDYQYHQCPHVIICMFCGNQLLQIVNEVYSP